MLEGFFAPGAEGPDSYDAVQRKRKLAEALMMQGMDYSPIRSPTQGLARLAQGLIGGYEAGQYDKQDKESAAEYNKLTKALMGGGSAPSAPAPSQSMTTADAGAAPGGNMPGDMSTYASAIKAKESGGKYDIVGPTHPKLGRALGAYQVMEANVGPWSREALGREVTPDEFLKNPQLQDQIFQHKFGQYVQKFGNPQDAASAWFTGRPLAQGANARDVLGTTGAGYVADFNRNIGQQQPTQVAQAPVASDAPPMAYAPGQQAISAAMPQQGPTPPPRPQMGSQVAQAIQPTSPPIPQPQPTGNVNAAMQAIMVDPRFSPQQKAQAMQLYQMQQKEAPEFTKIGEDEFKRPIMGWVDKRRGTITPANVAGGAGGVAGGQPQGGPSSIPPAPPGVDPVEWRKKFTEKAAEDAQGPKTETITSLRKEVQQLPSYKNLAAAAPIYQAMTRAANVDSRAADLDLVYGLAKIFDPTSVVREGEMIMVQNTAGIPQQILGMINSLNGGARLESNTRTAVMAQAHNRIVGYNDQFGQDANMYKGIASRQRMNVDDILPNFGEFKPWKPATDTGGTDAAMPRNITEFSQEDIQAELKRRGLAQ